MSDPVTEIVTLSVAEIIDLAEFAGLVIDPKSLPDEEFLTTELTITNCPAAGLFEDEEDTTGTQFAHLAHFSEYPEEGSIGLGPELKPVPAVAPGKPTHYVSFNSAAYFVKEAGFFVAQGGLRDDWGKGWVPVVATSIEDARSKAPAAIRAAKA